jgi:N-acetylmuramoyl-L-alanine amidase
MGLRQDRSSWQTAEPFLWTLIRNNVPVLLFLLLSATGMLVVYWFYAAPDEGIAEAVAVAGSGEALTAPIFKEVPARPVEQRFTQTPGPLHVAIIAGHMNHDSGAVCQDGLTEADVNLKVAHSVVAALQERDIPADVFAEFDPRLDGYVGTALVSIHADSCDYVNELATGFKISGSPQTDSSQLSTCVEQEYQTATGLPYHANTITDDMRDYHAFGKIGPGVPAVIIEIGFMNLDRELLTTHAEVPARGLVDGVLCYLETRGTLADGTGHE